jgi:ABC-2 type transport system ATP-binding protein
VNSDFGDLRRGGVSRRKEPHVGDSRVAITLVNLTKRYGKDVLAVDSLSLEVEQGMIFGLLGPNGAGKTTVLRMVLGLVHPTAGEVLLFGRRMYPGSPMLGRVGALVENPGFVPHLSGMDNLKQFWLAGGQPLEQAHFDKALEIADLGGAIRRKVRTYSHGMLQRLALAQVLLNEPDLLLLDEPTTGLDPQEMREIRDLVRKLAQQGSTVFLSSHILAEVEQVCTHAAVMNRGRLVAIGSVGELVGAANNVYLEVDDTALAMRVLQGIAGIQYATAEPPGISVHLNGLERKKLVAALVNAGVGVETVASRHRLEDAFIDMLQGDDA